MSMSIGVVDGLQLTGRPQIVGNTVTFTGYADCETPRHRDVLGNQLRAFVSEDVGPQPIIVTETPEFDGFATVTAVAADPGHDSDPVLRFTIETERISAAGLPTLDYLLSFSLRENAQGFVQSDMYAPAFVPAAAVGVSSVSGLPAISTEFGDIAEYTVFSSIGSSGTNSMIYQVAAADRLAGGCRVEWGWQHPDTSALIYTPLVGRVPPTTDLFRSVRITNGRFRAVIGNAGEFVMDSWNGSAWVAAPGSIFLAYDNISTFPTWNAARGVEIIRNTPEAVTIRLFATEVYAFSLTLQRGHEHFEATIDNLAVPSANAPIYAEVVSGGTGTTDLFNMRRASTATSGRRWAMVATSGVPSGNLIRTNTIAYPQCVAFGFAAGTEYLLIPERMLSGIGVSEVVAL